MATRKVHDLRNACDIRPASSCGPFLPSNSECSSFSWHPKPHPTLSSRSVHWCSGDITWKYLYGRVSRDAPWFGSSVTIVGSPHCLPNCYHQFKATNFHSSLWRTSERHQYSCSEGYFELRGPSCNRGCTKSLLGKMAMLGLRWTLSRQATLERISLSFLHSYLNEHERKISPAPKMSNSAKLAPFAAPTPCWNATKQLIFIAYNSMRLITYTWSRNFYMMSDRVDGYTPLQTLPKQCALS